MGNPNFISIVQSKGKKREAVKSVHLYCSNFTLLNRFWEKMRHFTVINI